MHFFISQVLLINQKQFLFFHLIHRDRLDVSMSLSKLNPVELRKKLEAVFDDDSTLNILEGKICSFVIHIYANVIIYQSAG